VVPESLAELPPGPLLAALLAGIDRDRCNGHDLVVVLEAQARQLAHEQARLLADLLAVAHCPPGGPEAAVARTTMIGEFAADEIRAALGWTRRAAEHQLGLAYDVVERLPAVFELQSPTGELVTFTNMRRFAGTTGTATIASTTWYGAAAWARTATPCQGSNGRACRNRNPGPMSPWSARRRPRRSSSARQNSGFEPEFDAPRWKAIVEEALEAIAVDPSYAVAMAFAARSRERGAARRTR